MNKNFCKAKCISGQVKVIEQRDVNDTVKDAKLSVKRRLPILLNDSFTEIPQRFVNCLTASTYVRPHNHMQTRNWELMSWLEGIVHVIFFDHTGKITDKITMSQNGVKVVEIPYDIYHTFITPTYGVYLEIRNCAYTPQTDRVYASWAPPEMSEKSHIYLAALVRAMKNETIIID